MRRQGTARQLDLFGAAEPPGTPAAPATALRARLLALMGTLLMEAMTPTAAASHREGGNEQDHA